MGRFGKAVYVGNFTLPPLEAPLVPAEPPVEVVGPRGPQAATSGTAAVPRTSPPATRRNPRRLTSVGGEGIMASPSARAWVAGGHRAGPPCLGPVGGAARRPRAFLQWLRPRCCAQPG